MFSVANNKQHFFHTKEEINMAQMYKNTENGKVVELVEINEKAKQVTVMYPDGTYKPYLLGSFKKHWKPVENTDAEQTEELEQKAEEKKPEQKAPKQKAEKKPVEKKAEKKSAPKQKKEKKDNSEQMKKFQEIDSYITKLAKTAGMSFYVRDKQPNFKHFKVAEDAKVCFNVMVNGKAVILNTKSKLIGEKLSAKALPVNHNFDVQFRFDNELTANDKKLLDSIVNALTK